MAAIPIARLVSRSICPSCPSIGVARDGRRMCVTRRTDVLHVRQILNPPTGGGGETTYYCRWRQPPHTCLVCSTHLTLGMNDTLAVEFTRTHEFGLSAAHFTRTLTHAQEKKSTCLPATATTVIRRTAAGTSTLQCTYHRAEQGIRERPPGGGRSPPKSTTSHHMNNFCTVDWPHTHTAFKCDSARLARVCRAKRSVLSPCPKKRSSDHTTPDQIG